MKKYFIVVLLMVIVNAIPVFAWDGYDYESGSDITIEKGTLVRRGRDIEFYDHRTREYHSGEVQEIDRRYSDVELEVYDYETEETRIFEMEK